jgi:putative FmdB family regulatory protein
MVISIPGARAEPQDHARSIRREPDMPTYEYVCRDCEHVFTVTMSITAHDTQKVECPKCKSAKIDWHPQSFNAVTAKKS